MRSDALPTALSFPNTLFYVLLSKALMWLFGAETVFFPCFFLPPPPLSGQAPVPHSTVAPTSVEYPLEATTFVVWGLTFGVISDLAVAGAGRAFAYQGPPYFRYVRPYTRARGLVTLGCL